MKIEIIVPQAGESVTEAMVGEWLKEDGDYVEMDDAIVEMETEKTNLELTAEESGTLRIQVSTGTVVKPGDVIGFILKGEAGVKKETQTVVKGEQPAKIVSPAARRIIHEENLNIEAVTGTGKDGRVTKQDAVVTARANKTAHKVERPVEKTVPMAPPQLQKPSPGMTQGTMVVSGEADTRVVPMSMMRRSIAQRLVEAQHTAAILTTFNEIDMSATMALRTRYKDAFLKKHGVKLGFMSFFVKACTVALKAFPEINAHVEDTNMVYHGSCDIGVAVGTAKGLVVPVIRKAENMSFEEIENTIGAFAERARNGKISIEDLEGGSFTISNGGVYGSLLSTPILNPPQSGILGMHKIEKRAVVVDDQIVIRPMMYVALSYDHRIVDGLGAVSFLIKVKECMEDPSRMLLGV